MQNRDRSFHATTSPARIGCFNRKCFLCVARTSQTLAMRIGIVWKASFDGWIEVVGCHWSVFRIIDERRGTVRCTTPWQQVCPSRDRCHGSTDTWQIYCVRSEHSICVCNTDKWDTKQSICVCNTDKWNTKHSICVCNTNKSDTKHNICVCSVMSRRMRYKTQYLCL